MRHRNGKGLGAESALCLHLALSPSLAEFLLWLLIHKRLSTRTTKYHMSFAVQNSYQHEDLAFTGGQLKKNGNWSIHSCRMGFTWAATSSLMHQSTTRTIYCEWTKTAAISAIRYNLCGTWIQYKQPSASGRCHPSREQSPEATTGGRLNYVGSTGAHKGVEMKVHWSE